jgi:hypothetical protein
LFFRLKKHLFDPRQSHFFHNSVIYSSIMHGKQTVLVVDDEEKILNLLKSYLEING